VEEAGLLDIDAEDIADGGLGDDTLGVLECVMEAIVDIGDFLFSFL
jgi:hypothetical protein